MGGEGPAASPAVGGEVADEMPVPCGLRGIRADMKTWFREAGAESLGQKVRVVAQSPALWALCFYRFGRWIRTPGVHRPRVVALPLWAGYRLLWAPVLWLTRVFLTVQAENEEDVWIHSHDSVWIGPCSRIGRGSRLYGSNTLGLGGRAPHRGVPILGRNVVLGPGVVLVGPIVVPDGAVLGACASGARDVPGPGPFVGSPPAPWPAPAPTLIPQLCQQGTTAG